ncbi:transposase [Paenibacillus sp. P26]|nr:transposase [Paenibacillus sp. P26]UUZ97015.1 transposase [Paenibacillus sp. P25]
MISNRHDVPKDVVQIYAKRWRIEVFFRAVKQELAFAKCHSESEAHHHAHFSIDCDIQVQQFARLIELFWPGHYLMLLWVTPKPEIYQGLPRTA